MFKKRYYIQLFFVITILLSNSYGITPDEIINKVDDERTYRNSKMVGEMVINDRFGVKKSTFISYTRGRTDTFMEFTSTEEKGQKMLRLANELYMFYPDSEELIRIRGAGLRDALFGSDISYEDISSDKKTLDMYNATLLGEETLEGKKTYKVELVSKKGKTPAYYKQILWVDAKDYVSLKVEFYSLSGKKIKEMRVNKIETISGKKVVTSITMRDLIRKNTSTDIYFKNIEINTNIDEDIFSLTSLKW